MTYMTWAHRGRCTRRRAGELRSSASRSDASATTDRDARSRAPRRQPAAQVCQSCVIVLGFHPLPPHPLPLPLALPGEQKRCQVRIASSARSRLAALGGRRAWCRRGASCRFLDRQHFSSAWLPTCTRAAMPRRLLAAAEIASRATRPSGAMPVLRHAAPGANR